MPAVFRISDPEETDIAMRLYGIQGTPLEKWMKRRGFKAQNRCLMIGSSDGQADFTKNVKKNVKKISRCNGAMYLTGYPVKRWEHGRFTDPYMREDLNDYGIVIDTHETAVTWDRFHAVHQVVRSFIKSRPQTICMAHGSHFYPQGTNLYFIFILKMTDLKTYRTFHDGIINAILQHGGSISHHHGIGKLFGQFMEQHLGKEQMAVLRALKNHFDPNNIMNPGSGHLGLG